MSEELAEEHLVCNIIIEKYEVIVREKYISDMAKYANDCEEDREKIKKLHKDFICKYMHVALCKIDECEEELKGRLIILSDEFESIKNKIEDKIDYSIKLHLGKNGLKLNNDEELKFVTPYFQFVTFGRDEESHLQ